MGAFSSTVGLRHAIVGRMRWIDRLSHAIKAFRIGPAVVENADRYFGTDPETYGPSVYGDYLVLSSTVYACANLKARNISSLPIRFYAGEHNNRREITSGPIVKLFKTVNPYWTYQRLMQMTQLSMDIWGEAFWVLEKDSRGIPYEIWWARPDRMRIVPHPDKYIEGYIYDWNGERIAFNADEVVWFRYPNPLDEFTGLSPIASARLAIDTGVSALKSNANIFKNGVQLAGVLSPMDKDAVWQREQVDALREMLDRRFRGVDKAHRIAILGQSAMFSPMSISPKDAQFMELMTWTRGDIAMVFQVPPELIGDHSHATYSNINQAYKGFWTDCLVPQATMIANEITEQLVKLFPNVDEAVLDYSGVTALQQDANAISEQAMRWYQMGVPLNKVLHELAPNLLPENGGKYSWGDAPPTQQSTIAPSKFESNWRVKQISDGSPEHQKFEEDWLKFSKIIENIMVESYGKIFSGQLNAVNDYLENLSESEYAMMLDSEFLNAVKEILAREEFSRNVGIAVGLSLALSFQRADALYNLNVELNQESQDARRIIAGLRDAGLRYINETTANSIVDSFRQAETREEMAQRLYNEISQSLQDRLDVIGATESTRIINKGTIIAAEQSSKVMYKYWVSVGDGKVRPTHRRAHTRYQSSPIPLSAEFEVGLGKGIAPGLIDSADENANCRCAIGLTERIIEQ